MQMSRFAFLAALMLLGGGMQVKAQAVPALDAIKNDLELTRAITSLDKQLFDASNACISTN